MLNATTDPNKFSSYSSIPLLNPNVAECKQQKPEKKQKQSKIKQH